MNVFRWIVYLVLFVSGLAVLDLHVTRNWRHALGSTLMIVAGYILGAGKYDTAPRRDGRRG